MKRNLKRFSCLLLAVVLSATMVAYAAPQAAAASGSSSVTLEVDYLPDMVTSWESTFYSWGTSILGSFYEDTYYQACWSAIDKCFAGYLGRCSSMTALQNRCSVFNNTIKKQWTASTLLYGLASAGKYPVVQVAYVPSLGAYSLVDVNNGLVLVNSVGAYTWYKEVSDPETDTYQNRKDIWLPYSSISQSSKVVVLSKDTLFSLCLTLNQTDRYCEVGEVVIKSKTFSVVMDNSRNVICNAEGYPYVAHYEATVTDQGRDYIINEGDTLNEGDTIYNDNSTIIEGSTTNYEIVDNSKVIDLTNGTLNYIGEQNLDQFYIDELLYDFSSQSYSADTYNVTYDNDTYNTWNYTWNITYNITNTYVTNIGQTELYKPLELYYVLPDGRSSADLTAEEIAGMSFEFADCVNYAKSATDTYLRALYHFDGNTDDSSYFSTQGKFEWVEGASITYMDVGTFDGALYLGPEKHQLKITLPSNIGSGDFTVQFRYYQEGAADTQTNIENSLSIGGTTVLQWDEGSLYSQTSTTACASLGVGAWSEIAVVRHSGTTYLYYNGLKIASFADTTAYSGNIVLALGDTTRASSMLDELRVVNFAVAKSGASYICTSVPYDTNAVLVLPDSAFPIADEYWDIESSYENLLSPYGLDVWADGEAISYLSALTFSNYTSHSSFLPVMGYDTFFNSVFIGEHGVAIGLNDVDSYYISSLDSSLVSRSSSWANKGPFPRGLSAHLAGYDGNQSQVKVVPCNAVYTLSLVDASGNVGSVTFTLTDPSYYSFSTSSLGWVASVEFNGYKFGLIRCGYYSGQYYCYESIAIVPTSEVGGEFVYLELVKGSSTDLTAEFVNCMYSSEEVKPNTAAIQTDIPINGYTVGGVRPTFPVRGDVWMPVSNNRISGVYIYNGSAWEEVNARWYTGTRWIPIYGFDLTTLEDCWDIADIDTTITAIGTESEFWNWWKRAWTEFREWLSGNLGGGGSGVSDDTVKDVLPDEDYVPDDPDTEDDEGSEGYSFFDLAKELVSGVWRTVKGFVRTSVDGLTGVITSVTYISDFFSFYDDDGEMHGIVNYGGDDIWD